MHNYGVTVQCSLLFDDNLYRSVLSEHSILLVDPGNTFRYTE